EDGIRNRNVTGVQTCALPIYSNAGGEQSSDDEYFRGEFGGKLKKIFYRYRRNHASQQTEQAAQHAECGGFAQKLELDVSFRRSQDRKSTRLNSSHVSISYAVF